jgi:hypothetical protein
MQQFAPNGHTFYDSWGQKYWSVLLFPVVVVVIALAANPQDVAADAVAKTFINTRRAAHLPPLSRMGRNTFGDKVCQRDLRMPSGNIGLVRYETSDPSQLPETAQKLAIRPDDGKRKAVRRHRGLSSGHSGWGYSQIFCPHRYLRITLGKLRSDTLGVNSVKWPSRRFHVLTPGFACNREVTTVTASARLLNPGWPRDASMDGCFPSIGHSSSISLCVVLLSRRRQVRSRVR